MSLESTEDSHLQGASSNEKSIVTEVPLLERIGGDDPPGFSPTRFNLLCNEFQTITQSPPPPPPHDNSTGTESPPPNTSPISTSSPHTNPPGASCPTTTNTDRCTNTPTPLTHQHIAMPLTNMLNVLNSNLKNVSFANMKTVSFVFVQHPG